MSSYCEDNSSVITLITSRCQHLFMMFHLKYTTSGALHCETLVAVSSYLYVLRLLWKTETYMNADLFSLMPQQGHVTWICPGSRMSIDIVLPCKRIMQNDLFCVNKPHKLMILLIASSIKIQEVSHSHTYWNQMWCCGFYGTVSQPCHLLGIALAAEAQCLTDVVFSVAGSTAGSLSK